MSDDDAAVLSGYTEGGWDGQNAGDRDAAAVKISSEGTQLWGLQAGVVAGCSPPRKPQLPRSEYVHNSGQRLHLEVDRFVFFEDYLCMVFANALVLGQLDGGHYCHRF